MLRGLDSGLVEKMTVRLGGNLLRSSPHLRNMAKFLVEEMEYRYSCIHVLLGIYLWQIVPTALMKGTILNQPKRREL
jgi:hypothetical protein